jgi:hypothetical protein
MVSNSVFSLQVFPGGSAGRGFFAFRKKINFGLSSDNAVAARCRGGVRRATGAREQSVGDPSGAFRRIWQHRHKFRLSRDRVQK